MKTISLPFEEYFFHPGKIVIPAGIYGEGGYRRVVGPSMDPDWNEVDWDALRASLLAAVYRLLGGRVWRRVRSAPIPGGREPKDFVDAAIAKTVTKQRRWDPARVTLYWHLVGVMRSDIGHLLVSNDNRYSIRATGADSPDNKEDNPGNSEPNVIDIDTLIHPGPTPEECAQYNEDRRHLLEYIKHESPDLLLMAIFILDYQLSTPQELSDALGGAVKDVNNMKKRLGRKLRKYQDERRRAQT